GRQMGELVRLLKGLKRRRFLDSALGRPWTSFVPDVPAERVPEYFRDFSQTFVDDLCPVAWYFAQVEPDGEVCFCGDFPDYFIGNVRKEAFADIWRGEKAQRFRAKLAKEPLPICNRCCGSYVYGKFRRPRTADEPSPSTCRCRSIRPRAGGAGRVAFPGRSGRAPAGPRRPGSARGGAASPRPSPSFRRGR